MKKKLKPSKPTTDLVWVDIALTSSPSDALAYGFMSPDLVPIINRLLNGGWHSLVIGGTCFEDLQSHRPTQREAYLQTRTTKWEEVSN
jgi:hypothetical protein